MVLNKDDHIVEHSFSVCFFLKYSERATGAELQIPQRLRHTGSKCIQENKCGRRACVPGDGFRHAIIGGMDIIVVIGVGHGIKVGVF